MRELDNWPIYGIGFTDAVRRAYRKTFVVAGRAGPGEYWWMVLFTLLATVGLAIFLFLIQSVEMASSLDLDIPAGLLMIGVYLGIAVPGFTLTIRRLHDTGRSGWFYLTNLIPFVGSLILLILVCQSPRPEGLRYGPSTPGQPYGAGGYTPAGSVWADSAAATPSTVTSGSSGRLGGVIVVGLVLLAGLGVGLAFVGPTALRQLTTSSNAGGGDGWTDPAPAAANASEQPSDRWSEQSDPYATEEPTDTVTEEPEPVPTDEPTGEITDAPATELDGSALVVRTSDGKACETAEDELAYESYPAATCRMWKKASGLLTAEPLAKGRHQIACQRDLQTANPTFTANQSNTWWVWAQTPSGAWDWFPETAIAEGVSDQAINGIALCESA